MRGNTNDRYSDLDVDIQTRNFKERSQDTTTFLLQNERIR